MILASLQGDCCFLSSMMVGGMFVSVYALRKYGGPLNDLINNPIVKVAMRGARRRWF